MSKVADSFIEQRSKILAMVQFTSRPDLHVSDSPEDSGLDLLVQTVFALDYLGLFGVALKGTIQSIRDAKEATQILGTMYREKSSDPSLRYPFPVVVLLFSMQDDSGYYAWLVEPVGVREGEPKLKLHGSPNCEPFNRTSLTYLIARVNDWYLKYFKYI